MSRVRVCTRLRDMLSALESIRADTAGLDLAAFTARPSVQRSVLYSLMVLGEAVAAIDRLEPGLLARFPDLPAADIKGMRNRIAHDYGRVDTGLVWNVAADDLADLEAALRAITLACGCDGAPKAGGGTDGPLPGRP